MNTPAPSPLGCAISEACVLSWLPDRPNRIKVQLPLGITNLITNFLLAAFPSLTHFPPISCWCFLGSLSNKLLAFKSLSAGLLLTNLDHWALRWSFPHRTCHQPLTCVFHSTPPLIREPAAWTPPTITLPLPLSVHKHPGEPLIGLQWLKEPLLHHLTLSACVVFSFTLQCTN